MELRPHLIESLRKLHKSLQTPDYADSGWAYERIGVARELLRQLFVEIDREIDRDPSPYCSYGHRTKAQCDCGPIAKND